MMLSLAQKDNIGSQAAAQLLLSTFSGSAFQVNIIELCDLNDDYFSAAIIILNGLKETGIQPHLLVEDGQRRFAELQSQWDRLHVENRSKPSCMQCFGSGVTPEFPDDDNNPSEIPCPACSGKGY